MVNGKPTCGNPDLTKTLRDDWKFDGRLQRESKPQSPGLARLAC